MIGVEPQDPRDTLEQGLGVVGRDLLVQQTCSRRAMQENPVVVVPVACKSEPQTQLYAESRGRGGCTRDEWGCSSAFQVLGLISAVLRCATWI